MDISMANPKETEKQFINLMRRWKAGGIHNSRTYFEILKNNAFQSKEYRLALEGLIGTTEEEMGLVENQFSMAQTLSETYSKLGEISRSEIYGTIARFMGTEMMTRAIALSEVAKNMKRNYQLFIEGKISEKDFYDLVAADTSTLKATSLILSGGKDGY